MASWSYVSGIQTAKDLSEGDIGLLGKNAIINTISDHGIDIFGGIGDRVDLLVAGQVLAQEYAAILLNFASLHLTTSSSALLMGTAGVSGEVSSSAWISNAGDIMGSYAGITLDIASLSGWATIDNAGRVSGATLGINLDLGNTSKVSVITNSGEIDGGTIGIAKNYTDGISAVGLMKVVNSGTISGGSAAIFTGNGSDSVINSGTINGLVSLGGGSDSVDNRLGLINGTVKGGAGSDSFRPGASEELFDGEGDADTVDLRGAATGVLVDLTNVLENTGVAEGDGYLNVENLIGTGLGDRFYGSDVANSLRGMAGDDRLSGRGGSDVLQGGVGKDSLWGGAGDDRFLFYRLDELGDAIADFGNSAGNNDQIRLSASGLGGGLVAGAVQASQFVTRAGDHNAQTATQRFILTSSDKTLWFDADGNGSGAAVLVADLQNSASLGAADLWLV